MKKLIHGINGSVEVNDPVGAVIATVGDTANETWRTIQAWQGKEAPSDLSYAVRKKIAQTVLKTVKTDAKPVVGAFTEAERARDVARGSNERSNSA